MRIEIGYYSAAVTDMAAMLHPANTNGSAVTAGVQNPNVPLFSRAATVGTSATIAQPFIYLLSGTMPTDISTWTNQFPLSAHLNATGGTILVHWGVATAEGNLATISGATVSIDTPYKIAIGSGIATWFMLGAKSTDTGDSRNSVLHQFVIGSVGLLGSGADLEVASQNVVTGSTYRITNLKITYPLVFEY